METGDVKISKTGSNGVQQMTYQRKVADFNTFIKSPEKFLKGTSVAVTDKVSAKPGDKDYKQLFAKLKMLGEQVSTLSAEIETNPDAPKMIQEAMTEINEINQLLIEGGFMDKLKGAIGAWVALTPENLKERMIKLLSGPDKKWVDAKGNILRKDLMTGKEYMLDPEQPLAKDFMVASNELGNIAIGAGKQGDVYLWLPDRLKGTNDPTVGESTSYKATRNGELLDPAKDEAAKKAIDSVMAAKKNVHSR